MTEKKDLELVEAFKNGDAAGFNELVRRYQEKLYWIARRILGTHQDADDAVQDIFIRVYEGLNDFRGESNLYTWLYRIAVNVSLNAIRRKRIKEFIPYDDILAEILPGDSRTDEPVLRQEYQTILEKAIAQLPPKQKIVFTMRYFDELKFEDMANILNKSIGGTKANYFHALQKISKVVRKETNQ